MSPLNSNDLNRCFVHGERIVRIEERQDDMDTRLAEYEARLEKAISSRLERWKFILTLIFTFLGSGTGLFLLGRILGGQ